MEKDKKVFYETVETETVNNKEVFRTSYNLHYGIIPGSENTFKPSFGLYNGCSNREDVYESILNYVKENPSHYFHVDGKNNKEKLYIDNYAEDKWVKVKTDELFEYSHKYEYEEVHPSVSELIHRLPADELVQWVNDNNIMNPLSWNWEMEN